jgi:hypothetical protein
VGRCILNQLVENGLVLAEDAERLLQVSELDLVRLHRIGDASSGHSYLSLCDIGTAFRDLPA